MGPTENDGFVDFKVSWNSQLSIEIFGKLCTDCCLFIREKIGQQVKSQQEKLTGAASFSIGLKDIYQTNFWLFKQPTS